MVTSDFVGFGWARIGYVVKLRRLLLIRLKSVSNSLSKVRLNYA